MLAARGFHVFRFDYFGTGDSAGESHEGRLDIWRENLVSAAHELRDIASISTISAVGFRLGAALAASVEGVRFKDLVLWEPIVDGRQYMRELEAAQWYVVSLELSARWVERPPELLGFPLPPELEAETRALRLESMMQPNAERVAIMVSEKKPIFGSLEQALVRKGTRCSLRYVADQPNADGQLPQQAALLSHSMLTTITAFLAS